MSPKPNVDRRWNESAKYVHARNLAGDVALFTPREWADGVARAARNPEDLTPRPDPQPEPPVEPEPQPEPWATGRWALSIDGQPGALDFDAREVSLPLFGTLAAEVSTVAGDLLVTFPLGARGTGEMWLTHADGRLTGTATAAGQTVIVTGQREAAPQPEPEEPAPQEPSGPPPSLPAGDPDFEDDFSSGDLSYSEGGFRWTSRRYTDVVEIGGQRALRFRYGPREPNGDSHMWAEQRFQHAPTLEQWIEYMLLLPANYRHGYDGGSANNIKLHAAWGPPGYSAPGGGVLQTWHTGDGNSRVDWARRGPDGGQQYPRNFTGGGLLFDRARHAGKWLRIRMHFRRSDPGKSNGIVRVWRDDELVYGLTTDRNHGSDTDRSQNPYVAGYLLGYDNPPYFREDTTFHIANFRWWATRNPGW